MPKFAANLSLMFNEVPFLDRFEAAAKAGFKAVEFLFPYDFPIEEIRARCDANGVQIVLFNLPPGNWAGGERGIACLPGREGEFRESVAKAIAYARGLDTPRVHAMAGVIAHSRAIVSSAYPRVLVTLISVMLSLGTMLQRRY